MAICSVSNRKYRILLEILRNANLPPAFYCWGTRDGFAGQFTQNANAVEQAGYRVERKILQNYPHGYGTGGNSDVWGRDFDEFLTTIMTGNSSVKDVMSDMADEPTHEIWFDLNGHQVAKTSADTGIYIVKNANSVKKILKR